MLITTKQLLRSAWGENADWGANKLFQLNSAQRDLSLVQMTLSICISSSNCPQPSLACGQCYTRKTLWATSSFALLVTFSFNFSFSVAPSNSVVSCKQHVPRELNRKEEHTETDRDFLTLVPHAICMIVPGRDQITSALINLRWRSEPLHLRTGWH